MEEFENRAEVTFGAIFYGCVRNVDTTTLAIDIHDRNPKGIGVQEASLVVFVLFFLWLIWVCRSAVWEKNQRSFLIFDIVIEMPASGIIADGNSNGSEWSVNDIAEITPFEHGGFALGLGNRTADAIRSRNKIAMSTLR